MLKKNILIYGSYIYGDFDYKPEDIDVGMIVKGSFFRYIIDQIKLPIFIRRQLILPVEKISIFIYGEENMARGIPIDDTVIAGVIHKQATLHELSVGYLRDIIIKGRDWNLIKNNERNILVTIGNEIQNCYIRLLNKGKKREKLSIRLKKIACRMIEINLLLKYLNQNLKLDFDYLFRLPTKTIKREVGYGEIKNLCDITFLKYTTLLKDYLSRFF